MGISKNAARQAFNLLAYKEIGRGIGRVVYDSKLLPDCVVKLEEGSGCFQNAVEWETWERVKFTKFAQWFAPCSWISGSGSILIQKRTRVPLESEFPVSMPIFLSDFKHTNYGVLGKDEFGGERLVCHDYGTNLLFEHGLSKVMKKANWWNL